MFRAIVSRGSSFDSFSQETVNLIFSHVNGKSAFEMFSFTYSEELARLPGIVPISPEKVIQSPLLLKNSFPK